MLIAFRDHADDLKKQFDIEGDVIPMSFIINNGDQDPAILINGFGEGYGDTGDHFAVKRNRDLYDRAGRLQRRHRMAA